jgi:hypothetical protein
LRVLRLPSPDSVRAGLTAIANDWRWLAVTWHVGLGGLLVVLLAGWRPSVRLFACLLAAPLVSVSLLAWQSGNPFNTVIFAALAATLGAMAARFPRTRVHPGSFARIAAAAIFVLFGATYPHFIRAESWTTYLYASPLGSLPCPTLSLVIGLTLVFTNFGSTSWTGVLAGTGLLYGVIGVFRLGVVLDWGLIVASAGLAVAGWRDAARARSVRPGQAHSEREVPLQPVRRAGFERVDPGEPSRHTRAR